MVTLGRLETVDLRNAWTDEAGGFTPWLAQEENITLLGDTVGLELEVKGREVWVGPFRADILCTSRSDERTVLIENQLEKTDHTHLGQILTYAAGLDAVTVIWIARRFTDEHRSALDWLNRVTLQGIDFFGLEIELWKIGNSALAPKFNVVVQPNEWQKQAKALQATSSAAGMGALHLQFWTAFNEYLRESGSRVRTGKPSADHWKSISFGRTGFEFVFANGMRDGFSEIALILTATTAKQHFALLQNTYRQEIEAALGPLDWRLLPNVRRSVIATRRNIASANPDTWPEIMEWFKTTGEQWFQVLQPLVLSLPRIEDEYVTEEFSSDSPNDTRESSVS